MDSRRVHRAGVISVLRSRAIQLTSSMNSIKVTDADGSLLEHQNLFLSLILLSRATRSSKEPKAHCAGAPTVCMHAVSGSISLPSRGSFRLSLTVLVHYRSITSI